MMKPMIRILKTFAFLGFFIKEVLAANFRLAKDILGSTARIQPGLIDLPLDLQTDRQRWILATCITMTPGTLSLSLNTDKSALRIHTLHLDEAEVMITDLKNRLERKVADAF